MALTYEILGSDDRTPVLMVVIVSTVVIPENWKIICFIAGSHPLTEFYIKSSNHLPESLGNVVAPF